MTRDIAVTLLALAAQAASGATAAVDLGVSPPVDTCRLVLEVAAISGTSASLAVAVQTSADGVTWATVRAWPAKTAAGREELVFQPVSRYVRATWTLTGVGASVTFGIGGTKRKAYCTVARMKELASSGTAFTSTPDEKLDSAIYSASVELDSHFAARYTLPITAWGGDVELKVAEMAAWYALKARGFNPEAGSDIAIRDGYRNAVDWCERVATNKVQPVGIVDSTPDEDEAEAYVETDAPRGW